LALVFCELLGNALEHGGDEVRVELGRANGRVLLTVADNGTWDSAAREGTGLSIVRALVTEELDGELSLVADHGLRAEVAFPAS
jgi:two-component sensor histidine kinase